MARARHSSRALFSWLRALGPLAFGCGSLYLAVAGLISGAVVVPSKYTAFSIAAADYPAIYLGCIVVWAALGALFIRVGWRMRRSERA